MAKSISLTETISINAAPEAVFDYVSDVSNDPRWRPEVEKMELKGERKLGAVIIEHITIYRFFRIVTPTEIRVLDRPHTFTVETPPSHPTWVQCVRTVAPAGGNASLFSVKLSFTLDNIRQISPFTPPAGLVRLWYQPRMRRYMKNIKAILENKPV
jgi:hypothetical protein